MCGGWLAFTKIRDYSAVTALDSAKAYGPLIWLMGSVRPFKTLPLLRVRPSDSRPPESRTRLRGPPSLNDRAASSWFLQSSMLLLSESLRCFSVSKGANHCLTKDQERDRYLTSLWLKILQSQASQIDGEDNKL